MEFLINVNELESHLQRCRLVQHGKDPQLLLLRATEEHLEISVGRSDAIVSSFLRKGEFYSVRNIGTGIGDCQTAIYVLGGFKRAGIVRLHIENDMVYAGDLQQNRKVPLTRFPAPEFYPTSESGRRPKVRLSGHHLLLGITKVMYALHPNCSCSLYDKIHLLVSKDRITFTAGDGIRFASYELTGIVQRTRKRDTMVYLPSVIVGPLVRNLKAGIGGYVTIYSNEQPAGNSPVLLVETEDLRIYASRPAGTYPDLRKFQLALMPIAATIGLSSFEHVIPVLKNGHGDHSPHCQSARLCFDFHRGTAALTTNGPDTPFKSEMPLQPGLNTAGEENSAVIQCRTKHLLEMYDSSDRVGHIVIRSNGSFDGNAALGCHVEYPTTYLDEGVHGKYAMFFPQSSIW